MINDFAKGIIERFPLGYVATVTKEGMPSLSPKGTFFVLDDKTIAFAEIRSPNTLENLGHQSSVEVNFVDVFLRKGVRIFGEAGVVEAGTPKFRELLPRWEAAFPSLAPRINAIVLIRAQRVKPLTTPPYDDGASEEEMVATYVAKYREMYP